MSGRIVLPFFLLGTKKGVYLAPPNSQLRRDIFNQGVGRWPLDSDAERPVLAAVFRVPLLGLPEVEGGEAAVSREAGFRETGGAAAHAEAETGAWNRAEAGKAARNGFGRAALAHVGWGVAEGVAENGRGLAPGGCSEGEASPFKAPVGWSVTHVCRTLEVPAPLGAP